MLQSLMMSCAMLILMGAVQGALWLGFILITYGRLSFGTLTAFQAYTMQVVMGIAQLAGSLFTLAQAKAVPSASLNTWRECQRSHRVAGSSQQRTLPAK